MLDGGPRMSQQAGGRRAAMPQRSAQAQRPAEMPMDQQPSTQMQNPPRYQQPEMPAVKRRFPRIALFTAIGLLLLLAIGWFVWSQMSNQQAASAIDGSKYQAVFFDNGEYYFGKLEFVDEDFMRLNDVFYIQTSNEDGESNEQPAAGEMQLIKLGEEVHGPEDTMMINRENVLFFENLKPDGRVSQLISEYKSNN